MIFVGSDHAGYQMKTFVVDLLEESGFSVEDLGTYSEESVDYPHYGALVAKKVVETPKALGVVLCGTGIGISIAANKVSGARVALCATSTHARLARQHNDANILAIGARVTGTEVARDVVQTFFSTNFEGGRHEKRVAQFSDIEHDESISE
ncbi:ribose 5-phosphate isomerase B [Candidatus Peregrinibacteria bacterium]|nr:MAG: ribose 5-phosphate isomerase B [Candidatus Peregrinibacteria bacterium]